MTCPNKPRVHLSATPSTRRVTCGGLLALLCVCNSPATAQVIVGVAPPMELERERGRAGVALSIDLEAARGPSASTYGVGRLDVVSPVARLATMEWRIRLLSMGERTGPHAILHNLGAAVLEGLGGEWHGIGVSTSATWRGGSGLAGGAEASVSGTLRVSRLPVLLRAGLHFSGPHAQAAGEPGAPRSDTYITVDSLTQRIDTVTIERSPAGRAPARTWSSSAVVAEVGLSGQLRHTDWRLSLFRDVGYRDSAWTAMRPSRSALRIELRHSFSRGVALESSLSQFSRLGRTGGTYLTVGWRWFPRVRDATRETPRIEAARWNEQSRQLRIRAPAASRVEFESDLTDWTAVDLQRGIIGDWWSVTLDASPGVHRFRVRIDGGAWQVPTTFPMEVGEYGLPAAVLVVPYA